MDNLNELKKTASPKDSVLKNQSFDINVKKGDLLPLLAQVQGLLEKRTHLQVLANVMIDADPSGSKIYASDSEISFSGTFNSSVKKSGRAVIDGKKLFEIIKELPSGDINLKTEKNNQVKISKDKSVFKIHGLSPDDFPSFPVVSEKATSHKIPVEDILEMIDKTLYCVSLDESRYHLTGVYCEPSPSSAGYRFVATDGHRMSFLDMPIDSKNLFKESFIIPKKALQEVKKMISSCEQKDVIEVCLDKPRFILKIKEQKLVIRLIEGSYPNYKMLIPKKIEKEIIVDREVFSNALRRISVLTNIRYKGVTFNFKDSSLTISISHPELGEATEVIDCDYKGEEVNIRFNAKYILDVLQSLHEKQVKIILKDQSSSGLFQGAGNKNYSSIIMPIKF